MTILAFFALTPALAAAPQAPDGDQERARIEALLQNAPKATVRVIEYRPIRGLEHTSQWHIGDSPWWVRLHHAGGFSMSSLDKAKRYRVTGVVLEQNYGVVEVWLERYSEVAR